MPKRVSDPTALKLVTGLIRIAGKFSHRLTTVRENESDDLVSDTEDEKRIHKAETCTLRAIKVINRER